MQRSNILPVLLFASAFLCFPFPLGHPARAQDVPENRLRAAVLGGGGGRAAGSGLKMGSTLGQPSAIGAGSNAAGTAGLGFWYGRRPGSPPTGDDPELPAVNRLFQNYPNPFNPSTTISFSLSRRAHTTLAIYNVRGQLVRVLEQRVMREGPHSVAWDGRNQDGRAVASGIYFYRLRSGRFGAVRKMVLLR